jgi:hypothetical protein
MSWGNCVYSAFQYTTLTESELQWPHAASCTKEETLSFLFTHAAGWTSCWDTTDENCDTTAANAQNGLTQARAEKMSRSWKGAVVRLRAGWAKKKGTSFGEALLCVLNARTYSCKGAHRIATLVQRYYWQPVVHTFMVLCRCQRATHTKTASFCTNACHLRLSFKASHINDKVLLASMRWWIQKCLQAFC